mgnify:CR=1 FL=1
MSGSLPTEYQVRDITISPAVVLAPMEGVTDLTFRRVIRSIGGTGLTYTEFIARFTPSGEGGEGFEFYQKVMHALRGALRSNGTSASSKGISASSEGSSASSEVGDSPTALILTFQLWGASFWLYPQRRGGRKSRPPRVASLQIYPQRRGSWRARRPPRPRRFRRLLGEPRRSTCCTVAWSR